MATESQYIAGSRGAGSRLPIKNNLALVVNGNSTVSGTFAVPSGSWISSFALETPLTISGTPTSCLVSIGTTLAGADIVAAVDCKSQGHIAATIVAAFDKIAGFVGFNTIYVQVVTSGGTASAGTINVLMDIAAPA
jgi:hypothetical protein